MGSKYLIIKKTHKQNVNIKINIIFKKANFQHKFQNLTIQERLLKRQAHTESINQRTTRSLPRTETLQKQILIKGLMFNLIKNNNINKLGLVTMRAINKYNLPSD